MIEEEMNASLSNYSPFIDKSKILTNWKMSTRKASPGWKFLVKLPDPLKSCSNEFCSMTPFKWVIAHLSNETEQFSMTLTYVIDLIVLMKPKIIWCLVRNMSTQLGYTLNDFLSVFKVHFLKQPRADYLCAYTCT